MNTPLDPDEYPELGPEDQALADRGAASMLRWLAIWRSEIPLAEMSQKEVDWAIGRHVRKPEDDEDPEDEAP
jgi:hypothetical protein